MKYLRYGIYLCMFVTTKTIRSSHLYYMMDFKKHIKLLHSRDGCMLDQLNNV